LNHLLAERLIEQRGEGVIDAPPGQPSYDMFVSITSKGVAAVDRSEARPWWRIF
jgi:hypothetical protein